MRGATLWGLLALAASLGCAAGSGQREHRLRPDPHAGILAEKCSACHDLAKVEEAHKTKTNEEMREILRNHKDKPGAEITEQDLKALLELY